MQNCLWLARTMPAPLTSGDRIYTAKLVQSLAETGMAITFVGLAGTADPAPIPNITWVVVPGQTRSKASALFSIMPLVGAQHATPNYRATLDRLLREAEWDVVVVDQYGMGWVLDQVGALSPASRLMFIAHDHEEEVTRQQWRGAPLLKPSRLYFAQNYFKTRHMERSAARACQVITAITDADAESFRIIAPCAKVVTITPGYDGPKLPNREITAATPRAVLLYGSYRWSAKEANLDFFLQSAYQTLTDAGIEIRVVGDMDEKKRQILQERYAKAVFTGFIKDPTPYFDSRLAVLAEPIGGGFKLKLLDYVFNRIPMAALSPCVTGLPRAVREATILAPDLDALVAQIIAAIDDTQRLDRLQRIAFTAAENSFKWSDRGRDIRTALGT